MDVLMPDWNGDPTTYGTRLAGTVVKPLSSVESVTVPHLIGTCGDIVLWSLVVIATNSHCPVVGAADSVSVRVPEPSADDCDPDVELM